jgi:osmotically-inducible protein OsmY
MPNRTESGRHNDPWLERTRWGRRGPKGFKRSDVRLKDDIAERLMYSEDIDPSDVTLEVKDAKVTLDGTVPERWMRYAIDDIAESVMGVEDVENNIRVRRTGDESTARAQARGGERRM